MARSFREVVARYFHELLATFSTFLNSVRGGYPRRPLCSALHENIEDKGWASRVWWPAWFREHCRYSASDK